MPSLLLKNTEITVRGIQNSGFHEERIYNRRRNESQSTFIQAGSPPGPPPVGQHSAKLRHTETITELSFTASEGSVKPFPACPH